MNRSPIYLLLISFCCWTCQQKEDVRAVQVDGEGVVTALPPLWSKSTTESEEHLNYVIVREGISHNGGVMVPKQSGDTHIAAWLNASTGETQWEWVTPVDNGRQNLILDAHYVSTGNLVFPNYGALYQIDLNTGLTVNKQQTDHWMRRMAGIGNRYFVSSEVRLGASSLARQGSLYTGTIDGGNYNYVFTPPYENAEPGERVGLGSISPVVPYINDKGEIMIAFFYSELNAVDNTIKNGLYNFTADSMVYSGTVLDANSGPGANSYLQVYEDLAFASINNSIICYGLSDGEIVWRKPFNNSFTFSGYIIADGVLLANNEDTYLYGIDPTSGRQLWKEKSSGTSSRMVAHNGVVYFVGGGDGLLHAVEIATGRHLWKLRSPDEAKNSGAFFMPFVAVVLPENEMDKPLIVVSSYLSAMAFEAAR